MQIRDATAADARQISEIYNYYVGTSHSTFETESVSESQMERRIAAAIASGYPFLVAFEGDHLLGYAYGSRFRTRPAYDRSVEVSAYVLAGHENRGIGRLLYKGLIDQFVTRGFHTAVAGISLPNDASIRLHERFGFQKVAHFREVGRKFDRWIDVGFWQLMLDPEHERPEPSS